MHLNNPPQAIKRTADLIDIPLIITHVGAEITVETALGISQAVPINVLVPEPGPATGFEGDADWNPGEPVLMGYNDVYVFWAIVRKQLASAKTPVAARFRLNGKAYVMDILTPPEIATLSAMLG